MVLIADERELEPREQAGVVWVCERMAAREWQQMRERERGQVREIVKERSAGELCKDDLRMREWERRRNIRDIREYEWDKMWESVRENEWDRDPEREDSEWVGVRGEAVLRNPMSYIITYSYIRNPEAPSMLRCHRPASILTLRLLLFSHNSLSQRNNSHN